MKETGKRGCHRCDIVYREEELCDKCDKCEDCCRCLSGEEEEESDEDTEYDN